MDPLAVASSNSSRRSSRRKESAAAPSSSSSSRSSASTVRSSSISISSSSTNSVSSMTAPPIQRSGHGNFSGGGASGFSFVAAPPIQQRQGLGRSMEAMEAATAQRAATNPRGASAAASLNLNLNLKKNHTDTGSRKKATTTAGGMSVSDAESSQIGYGYGDCADYYQLPLYDSDSHYEDGDDEDDGDEGEGTNNEDELTASAYFHSQQSATIVNKSKRRRPSKSSKAAPKSTVRWCDSNRSFLSRDRFVKKYLSDSLLLSNSSVLSNNSNNSTTSSFRRRVSFSSSSSSASSFRLNRHAHASHAQSMLPVSSCYVPLPKNATRAAELENDILLSSSASNSSLLEDAALVDMARAAKKKIESVAKRQVMVGKWKQRYVGNSSTGSHYQSPRHRNGLENSASDSQVYEYLTSAKDQYSVVAKINLPCSLLEIQSVLMAQGGGGGGGITSRSTEFHRSMVMLFGDQYVYGLNVRSIDCAPYTRRSSSASTATGMARRGSRTSTRSSSSHNQNTNQHNQPPSVRLAINAVSLLMKRRLVWKQQNMSFLDYCDEKPHAKTVTRVLQTLDTVDEEDQEDDESNNQDGDVYRQTKRRQSSPLQLHESRSHVRGLRGLLAGYVLQEDSEEKFTRLFFYATHKSPTTGKLNKPKRVTAWSVQLLREMVSKLCTLETVVLRRRLGFYPIMDVPSRSPSNHNHNNITRHSNSSSNNSTGSDVALLQNSAASCCSSCYVPFNALLFRRKHFCHLCGHYTCRKCSRVEPIEKILGLIDHRRVCVSCVRRVNYCVFNMDGAFYSQQQEQQQLYQQQLQQQKGKAMMMMMLNSDGKKLSDVPEEEFPPLLGEDDDDLASTIIEDLALFPDEHLENDLASEKVTTYLKKMFERSIGGGNQRNKSRSPLDQQQQQLNRPEPRAERTAEIGDYEGDAGATAETTGTTPKESICLLDSARSSVESGDENGNYAPARFA